MLRTFSVCATLAALSLVASQQVSAGGAGDGGHVYDLRGTYAFTLAESCVQQNSFDTPGFDPKTFAILDSGGAMTYGGASNGLMVFDGRGKVSIEQAAATNIFNAASFLATGSVPLGFGFGPALPFTCTGAYTLSGGNITANFTCTATLPTPNPANFTGFQSTFNMTGVFPEDPSHLVLTDLGNTVQPVIIFVQNSPNLNAQRVCTRATTLNLVSGNAGQ